MSDGAELRSQIVKMVRASNDYVCQECGAVYAKWSGRCDDCGGWNTIVEETRQVSSLKRLGEAKGRGISLEKLGSPERTIKRIKTGLGEFDRVVGGGLVAGSANLISGDPGIGKSTLVLQGLCAMAASTHSCIYVSGEESADQVRLRARRLGLDRSQVHLAASTNVNDILATLLSSEPPQVLVIDSIQTMYVDHISSAPGAVSQVRASAQELIQYAKLQGVALILVGHVTKEGQIAGPRVLEHMVDVVLHFEGDHRHQFRLLRAVKNRFGATDEVGVFEMTEAGLSEVENPSALFLGRRSAPVSGLSVFAGLEGSRPMLVEIEALVTPAMAGAPRRAVVGIDGARLAMIVAVLDSRCGLALGAKDIHLNVAGGLRISEPAADLAVAGALLSSVTGTPTPARTIIFGETGLTGEVRPVSGAELRLKEAIKLGYPKAIAPPVDGTSHLGVDMLPITTLSMFAGIFSQDVKRFSEGN